MSRPAIGSKWRSKRNGRVATVNMIQAFSVQLRFCDSGGLRWVALTVKSGHPCGYEPVEEVMQ